MIVTRKNARLAQTAANSLQKAMRAAVAWADDPTPARRAIAERKRDVYMQNRAAAMLAADRPDLTDSEAKAVALIASQCDPILSALAALGVQITIDIRERIE